MLEWERSAFDMVKLVILQQIKLLKLTCVPLFSFSSLLCHHPCAQVFLLQLWLTGVIVVSNRPWHWSSAVFFLSFSFLTKESHENPWQSFMSSLTVIGCLCPFSPLKDNMIQDVCFFFPLQCWVGGLKLCIPLNINLHVSVFMQVVCVWGKRWKMYERWIRSFFACV